MVHSDCAIYLGQSVSLYNVCFSALDKLFHPNRRQESGSLGVDNRTYLRRTMKDSRRALPPASTLLPFEATARLQSVTKAAAELRVSKTAVRRQIHRLETYLGTKLILRRSRGVRLTSEGNELARVVSYSLAEIGKLSELIQKRSKCQEILLHCHPCGALYRILPRIGVELPHLNVQISISNTSLDDVDERYDLAVQCSDDPVANAELIFKASDEVFPICSPEFLSKIGGPLSPEELPEHDLLIWRCPTWESVEWDTWFLRQGLTIRTKLEPHCYDTYQLMISAVINGDGIALGRGHKVQDLIKSNHIVRAAIPSACVSDRVSIHRSLQRPKRDGTDELLRWLKSELSSSYSPNQSSLT